MCVLFKCLLCSNDRNQGWYTALPLPHLYKNFIFWSLLVMPHFFYVQQAVECVELHLFHTCIVSTSTLENTFFTSDQLLLHFFLLSSMFFISLSLFVFQCAYHPSRKQKISTHAKVRTVCVRALPFRMMYAKTTELIQGCQNIFRGVT